jgi:predicted transcriptional regulator
MGRVHRYFPLVSKEAYSTSSIKSLVDAYFEGSFSEAVSCMLQQKEISVSELELLLDQLKQSKN